MNADAIAVSRAFQRGAGRPPEVNFGIICAVADRFDEIAKQYPEISAQAGQLRRTASTLVPLFRFETYVRQSWLDERAELPFWRRLRTPKQPPSWFADEWHDALIAEGRNILAEEVAAASEVTA